MRKVSIIIFSLIITLAFTVTLSESLPTADALSAIATKIKFEMQVGETQIQTWNVINNNDDKGWVEFYADGPGSEFLTFKKVVAFEIRENKDVEIIVSIPDDHPDNIEYRPLFFALKRGDPLGEGVTGAQVNVQLKKVISIKIGDNPIYTAPLEEKTPIIPDEIIIPEKVAAQEAKETLKEKLARIAAENEQFNKPEVKVVDTSKELIEKPIEEPTPEPTPECRAGTVLENGICKVIQTDNPDDGGGCLIATAAFGSEMAPQVQLLREIRDNQLMGTSSGMAFMSGFNQLYYSFSPYIADMERDSPIFKEMVKLSLTPMLSTLSVMEYADSEESVLGLGIGVILMNLGMYVGLPTFGLVKLIKKRN